MTLLILGLVIFFLPHVFTGCRSQRAALIDRIGEMPYKGLYSLLALAGLVLIVMGKGAAQFVSVWVPPAGLNMVPIILMLPALVFLVVSNVPCNLRTRLKHPMLIAIKIWATAHLIVNGDLASILLFGSFLAYAVVTMIRVKRREALELPAEVPDYPLWRDIMAIVLGGVLYAGIGMHHAQLFGVAIH